MKYVADQNRFTIRKLTVGVCSVCLSVLLMHNMNSTSTVFAEEQTKSENTELTKENNSQRYTQDHPESYENIVKNGNFSQTEPKSGKWTGTAAKNWDSPWVATASDTGQVEVEDGRLKISSTKRFRVAVTQVIDVDANQKYDLSYDVETKDLLGSGVRARVRSLDENGKDVIPKEFAYTNYVNGSNKQKITQQFQFVSETKKVKLELFFENSQGTAYFDNVDFRIHKESDQPQEQVKPESGVVELTTNKRYIPNLKDATYTIENEKIALVKDNVIIPKQVGVTEVGISEENQKIGSFTLRVKEYADDKYSQILKSWEDVSLGNENYDPNNHYMHELLDNIEQGIDQSLEHWDENLKKTDFTVSANLTKTYRQLEKFAQVIDNPHSKYYENYDLARKLNEGMNFLYENAYNEKKQIVGNWWDYEIGTPRAIIDILTYANKYFTQEEINRYIKPIDKFVDDPTIIRSTTPSPVPAVGGNQTDMSKVTILSGALKQDENRIQEGVDALNHILKFVQTGEGFYEDGSFIDHTNVAYTGAYGSVLIDEFSQILPMIAGTEFVLPAAKTQIIYDWIDRSYFPIIINGELMDMTRGRSISRVNSEDHVAAIEVLRGIVRIAQASDSAKKEHLLESVKGRISNDNFYSPYNNLKSYTDIALFEKLLADNSIHAKLPKTYIHAFHNMDKFVYNNAEDKFAFAISMYSDRTQNYEDMNNENRHGWYSSDGMIYLYNGDLSHYSNGYWPTVDPYLLPGTTELVTKREDGSGETKLPSGFVGSTKLNDHAAAVAMDFSNYNNKLSARKGRFIFDNKIVFLTTDIQNKGTNDSITTIENRKLIDPNTKIYIDGQSVDLSHPIDKKVTSIYIEPASQDQQIGYALTPLDIQLSSQERTHSWKEINYGQPDTPITNTFITVTHKTKQNGENLAYILLPNQSKKAIDRAAKDVRVIDQNKDIQVVYDQPSAIYGVIKYSNDPYKLNDSLVLKQAGIYMIKDRSEGYEISFAHPRQEFVSSDITENNPNYEFKVLKPSDDTDRSTIISMNLLTNSGESSDRDSNDRDTAPIDNRIDDNQEDNKVTTEDKNDDLNNKENIAGDTIKQADIKDNSQRRISKLRTNSLFKQNILPQTAARNDKNVIFYGISIICIAVSSLFGIKFRKNKKILII